MKSIYIFIILFIVLVALIVSFTLYFQYRSPYCGDELNKKNFLCNSANEDTCNPTNTVQYYDDIVTVIEYIMANYEVQKKLGRVTESNLTVTHGVFYYAISELLRVMPTDFGQNSLSPYGFATFFPIYPTCISDVESFCAQMFPSNENSQDNPQQKGQDNCQKFLEALRLRFKKDGCPFPLRDDSKDLFVGDSTVFNQFGMLGSTSMSLNSGIIIRICLPLDNNKEAAGCCTNIGTVCYNKISLALSYWSFALYKMESMNRDDICYPNYQVNAASICAPLNMYGAVAEAYRSKNVKKDPLRNNFHFAILINFNEEVDTKMRNTIANNESSSYYSDFDFVYTMKIPNIEGSLPLSKNIPNPNNENSSSKYFDPSTDRFGLISRLVEDEELRKSVKGYTPLNDFVNERLNQQFTVQMWTYDENSFVKYTPHDFQPFPLRLNPPINEKKEFAKEFRSLKNKVLNPLELKAYTVKRLPTRYNLVNITAPYYNNVRNGKIAYQGGFQAIQMAGNMQGDNPDAQYRLQQAECIDDNSVIISICVNHQNFDNCYYNSLNITDGYQAYGFYGFNPGKGKRYIVFMTGRNPETLKMVEKTFRSNINQGLVDVHFKTILTDKTQVFGIPECHPVLMIERIYLNNRYVSKNDPNKIYQLRKANDFSSDEIESMINITGPELDYFIEPCFYKVTQNLQFALIVIYSVLVILFLAVFIAFYIYRWRRRHGHKNRKERN